MKIAIVIMTCICMIYSRKRYDNWYNPYFIFNLLWLCVFSLLLIGNHFVFEPSKLALICVSFGIIGFNLSIISPKLTFKGYSIINNTRCKYEFNYKMALLISSIALILSIISSISSLKAFISGTSFVDIRHEYYTYTGSGSVISYYIRNYVSKPLRYIVILSTIISVFKEKRKSIILLVNTVIIVLCEVISSGGRYVLMNTMFMFICGFFIFTNKKNVSKKSKILLTIFILGLLYMIVFLTNERATYQSLGMNTGQRLYLTIYEYFAGSITYLGEMVKTYPFLSGKTFGLNFFAGFLTPVFTLFTYLHLIPYPEVFNTIGTYACDVLQIGNSTYYNAMPTAFGYFYIDGGIVAAFLEAWIIGYISKRIYEVASANNLIYCAMYILLFIQLCNMSTRWFFFSADYCLAFIYLRLLFKKNSNHNLT